MRAGTLRTPLTIQQQAVTQDAIGQPLTTWTTFAEVWGDLRYKSGAEVIRADAESSAVKCSIRIRYLAGVTAGMRVTDGATTFDIEAVMPDQHRVYVDLVCRVFV
jgi:SPP1 family predicted phage head-tail adaptor